jgi:hypothetical protein
MVSLYVTDITNVTHVTNTVKKTFPLIFQGFFFGEKEMSNRNGTDGLTAKKSGFLTTIGATAGNYLFEHH